MDHVKMKPGAGDDRFPVLFRFGVQEIPRRSGGRIRVPV